MTRVFTDDKAPGASRLAALAKSSAPCSPNAIELRGLQYSLCPSKAPCHPLRKPDVCIVPGSNGESIARSQPEGTTSQLKRSVGLLRGLDRQKG